MQRALAVLFVLVPVAGCGGANECDPTTESCTYAADVSTLTVPAGAEEEDTCQSWTLNNKTELWVTSITQRNDGGYHHADWFFVPDNQYVQPDGAWPCSSTDFTELTACCWGVDTESTGHAVEAFAERYLDDFLEAATKTRAA